MKTGCPMQMITKIPYQKQLGKICTDLSKEAKHRLKIIDWYKHTSKYKSKTGKADVSLTCVHFGINRSYFYYWFNRFNKDDLHTLDNKTTTPKNTQTVRYTREIVETIRELRKEHPTYSKITLNTILERDYEIKISASTIGRIINRYNMYYIPKTINKHKKISNGIKKANERKRIPFNSRAVKPNEIIEFDMKHINVAGGKFYAMCGIDQFTKKVMVHITKTPSSNQAKKALEKIINKFGEKITIYNDNGSENMGEAECMLKNRNISQYWARPHKPKDKPFIERFIGTLQRECLDFNYDVYNCEELQKICDNWIEIYENYRPHRSLNMLTPSEYENIIIKENSLNQCEVS